MKKAFSLLLALSLLLPCLFGCASEKKFTPDSKISTECEGVYLTLSSIEEAERGSKTLNAKWNNQTDNEVIYGEAYYIERESGGLWVDTSVGEHSYIAIACILSPHSENDKSYSTAGFDISREGRYRLRTEFSTADGNYSTWIEFEVTNK